MASRRKGTGGIKWDGDLTVRLDSMEPKLVSAVTAAVEFHATRAEGRLRSEAPWTDRTSNARNGLFARAVHTADRHAIVLYHSVPYGIWLEVRWSGRYAVIEPVRNSEGRELMLTISGLLGRLS